MKTLTIFLVLGLIFTCFPAAYGAKIPGYTRVMVELKVPDIKALTAESTKHKVIRPGKGFPSKGHEADLDLKTAISTVADTVLYKLNGTQYQLNRRYSYMPYLALEVSGDAWDALKKMKEVKKIKRSKAYIKKPLKKVKKSTSADVSSPMLTNTVTLTGANGAWNKGYTGSGYYVAILDTGIRNSHEFFDGKTIKEHCFSVEAQCPGNTTEADGTGSAAHYDDDYGAWQHGTVVAGIAAGHRSNNTLNGVAKGANIIAVQVCSYYEDCSPVTSNPCVMENEEDVLAGLDYIYGLRSSYSIAAVNLSLGDGAEHATECCDDPDWGIITEVVGNLKTAGIATIAASGNDNYCGGINAPACISYVISVGGSTDSDTEWQGSTYGSNWHSSLQDLFAPAHQVYSSDAVSNSAYVSNWSGTSLAAPHVVGAFALIKDAFPSASVDSILNALKVTGEPVSPSSCGTSATTPRIRIDDAIDELAPPWINVTKPTPNSYSPLEYVTITWSTFKITGNVTIKAESSGYTYTIDSSHSYNGSPYIWRIPYGFNEGVYRIRVYKGSTSGYSGYIVISKYKIVPF
jgi:subtilisin family serine protease